MGTEWGGTDDIMDGRNIVIQGWRVISIGSFVFYGLCWIPALLNAVCTHFVDTSRGGAARAARPLHRLASEVCSGIDQYLDAVAAPA